MDTRQSTVDAHDDAVRQWEAMQGDYGAMLRKFLEQNKNNPLESIQRHEPLPFHVHEDYDNYLNFYNEQYEQELRDFAAQRALFANHRFSPPWLFPGIGGLGALTAIVGRSKLLKALGIGGLAAGLVGSSTEGKLWNKPPPLPTKPDDPAPKDLQQWMEWESW